MERRIQAFENKCYRRMLGISYRAHKYVWQHCRSTSSSDVRSFYYQPSSIASYHGLAMSAVMMRYQKLCFKEQWMYLVVPEEYRVNHGRIG